MISFFKKNKKKTDTHHKASETETSRNPLKSTVTLVPGSKGEHALQEKYGTRQRALKFYDKQMLNHLSPIMTEFITKQEVMFVATADGHGECDCSARFGKPGFVRVINQQSLIYPEYRGNGVLASQGNILENPHVGIIFVDFFETTVGLHVNGAARVIESDHLLETGHDLPEDIISEMQAGGTKRPERWIMIEVEEAYIHCSKHIPLLKKQDKRIDWGTDNVAAKGGDFFQLEELSLYDRIGGKPAVKKAVDVLHRKIIADPEINHFFENVDITSQIERQTAFLSMIFGNKDYQYSPFDLRESHKHLVEIGLNDTHFDRLVGHLNASLNELEVPNHEIESILEMVESMRGDVLGR